MINNELLSFINKELALGKSRDQIKNELIVGGGWSAIDIEEVFKDIDSKSNNILQKNIKKQKVVSNSFGIIILIFMFCSMFPPWSLIATPLQSLFGVSPAQEEERFHKEFKEEQELFPFKEEGYYDQDLGIYIEPTPEEKEEIRIYNENQFSKIMAYREKNKNPFGFLSLLGGPITVGFVGLIFFLISTFFKRNSKKNEFENTTNDDLITEDVIVTRLSIIKSQVFLIIEIGIILFVAWLIIRTRNECRGVGGFCGLGIIYILYLIGPLFLIFTIYCKSYASAKIKKLKLNNLKIPIWFKLLNIFPKLILILFTLIVLFSMFGPYVFYLIRT